MSSVAETKHGQKPSPPGTLPPPGAPNDPYRDQPAYLASKGWRCLGNPEWNSSLWLDPDQPLVARYSEEPCMYEVEVREEYTDERDGLVKVRYKKEMRQIMAQDGRGGASQAARRTVYHPKVTPVNLAQAMMIQMERDVAATLKSEETARRAEQKRNRP
jgi:hypothetical protein